MHRGQNRASRDRYRDSISYSAVDRRRVVTSIRARLCLFYVQVAAYTHIRARVRRETSTRYADVASVLLAISEIASETLKSFIFFAVCEAQSANFPPSFSLSSLSFHSISPSFRVCTRFFDPDRVGHVSFTLDPS